MASSMNIMRSRSSGNQSDFFLGGRGGDYKGYQWAPRRAFKGAPPSPEEMLPDGPATTTGAATGPATAAGPTTGPAKEAPHAPP